ncbi:MAG: amidohydrolase family protein [Woeseiaceae bacterium]
MPGSKLPFAACVLLALILVSPVCATTTAFINVNVVSMTSERVDPAQTVLVENGRISVIGPVDKTPLPKDIEIVDGTDRYLMPGLAEMHAHVPDVSSQELGRVMTLFVANGVTTIRGMLGRPSHLQLRDDLLQEKAFGPRLVTSGPSLNGDSVRSASSGVRQVREQFAAGYDFIKIHPGLGAEEFAAIADTANELGMPFAGHVPVAVGVSNALASGMATIDHLDGYLAALMPADSDASGGYGGFFDVLLADQLAEERIAELATQTATAGTWNVATEALFEHRVSEVSIGELSNLPEMRYMPQATVQQWVAAKQRIENERGFDPEVAQQAIRIRRMIIKALQDAGAGLLLGSDAPQVFNVPGFSVHHELRFMVESGLTPYEAIATGTTAVANFLGSNTGSIEVGRDADLVLLDSDPLADITSTRRVHGVMLRGRWYSSAELKKRLDPYHTQNN